ncbi:MAG: PEP-CTERM sorting domain-containing protein [Terriglobales bacterium]
MKRNIWMGITGMLGMLAFLGTAAMAQSSITLDGGAGQHVVFSGQGSGTANIGVSLGSCNMKGDCTLSGTGSGSGSLSSSGSFTLDSAANSIMLTSNGHGGYSASATAPIDFKLTGSANGHTGTLLTGTLNLLNFTQASGSSQGTFNTNLAANLSLTGGLLANVFTATGGILNLNVSIPTSTNVSTVVGTKLSLAATLSASGAGGVSPTPEPSTLALMGVGLLALGFGLRRARHQAGIA